MKDDKTVFIDVKVPHSLYEKIIVKFNAFVKENLCEPKTLILSMEYYTWFAHIANVCEHKCKFFGMEVTLTEKQDTVEVY